MNEFNPYEAPQAELMDQSTDEGFELADRGTRLGAALLDGFILWGPLVLLTIITIPFAMARQGSEIWVPVLIALSVAFLVSLATVTINLILLHRYGQTLGKRLLRIRIVRSDGNPASLGRIVGLRIIVATLPSMVPYLGSFYSITDACFIFREDRRCLHDLIADTLVVKA